MPPDLVTAPHRANTRGHAWRLFAMLVAPLVVVAALIQFALPGPMNRLATRNAEQNASALAAVLASTLGPDLDFDDGSHAGAALATLGAHGDVVSAVVRDAGGTPFAMWPASFTPGALAAAIDAPSL